MLRLSAQVLMVLVLLETVSGFGVYPNREIFGKAKRSKMKQSSYSEGSSSLPPEFEIHHYTQTLDHFNYKPESYATFQQRYILNFKYWGRADTSSPIFVYVGEETSVVGDAIYAGFIINLAARAKGLLLYIEHRYYGKSYPFGSEDKALQNAGTLGYLSSEQALADYAQVVVHVKEKLSAEASPVIAVGGSYGGMLAAWFRLKYPHIVHGALASSAPVFLSVKGTPQEAYYAVISRAFKETSESCYNTIKKSWSEIDRIAAEPNGLVTLGKAMNSCRPLTSSYLVKYTLARLYWVAAQYDRPPDYYLKSLCNAINRAPTGTDIIGRIHSGMINFFSGNTSECLDFYDDEGPVKWSFGWQKCTELVIAAGVLSNDTMFQASPFDLTKYTKGCKRVFGIEPRLDWIPIQFGGREIKSALRDFGSNIIFSNGLRDPFSAAGVLENISDSIIALYAKEGAHVADLLTPAPNDPAWLVTLREQEMKIIATWLAKYYTKQK